MHSRSILKSKLLIVPAIAWAINVGCPATAAEHATRSSAIGQRAAAAIQQQNADADIKERLRRQLPIMVIERHSETAIANNRHNLSVIDNVVGKALEILALAFGVAIIVSAAIEQKGKKQETLCIAIGSFFVLFGLFCPPAIHAICDLAAKTIFH